jgi:DNA polymerase I
MSTKAGEPTSALYGFSALLLKLLREQRGASLAFALDAPQATFRHDSFDAYKAGRAPTPTALSAQFGRLRQLLAALAVPVFRCPGFEADDVLATLAKRARDTAHPALIVSGDRDMLQLARGSIKVNFVGRRGKDALVYDEALVVERFGIPSAFLPSLVALIGDPSDNLPGVPGIGAATASKLLAGKSNCRELLDHLEDVKSARTRDALHAHREQILHTESLARLREDAPIGDEHTIWSAPSADALSALAALFEELEFQSLRTRLQALLP